MPICERMTLQISTDLIIKCEKSAPSAFHSSHNNTNNGF